VVEQLTRALAWMLRRSAGALPPGRREWGEAAWAEAGQVPAGWPRWCWLAGGLRLVAKEAPMTRRIGYGLGAALVAAVAAWAAWLSWQRALPGDADSLVDRARVIELAAVLAVLPWVARRRGVFGPGGGSAAMRLLRIGGCATLCAMVLSVVHLDQTAPGRRAGDHEPGGALGNFSLAGEAKNLGLLAILLTVVLVLTAWRRTRVPAVLVAIAGSWAVFWIGPFQLFTVLYAAGILAATSRRSELTPASLGIGAAAGIAGSLLAGLIKAAAGLPAQPSDQTGLAIAIDLAHLAIVIPVLLLITGAAALIAARRTPAAGSNDNIHQIRPAAPGRPDPVRIDDSPRVRQGLGAGMTAGAVAGLMITILLGWWPTLFFGPLLAVPAAFYGAMTGAQAAPPEPRPNRSWLGGVFAASLPGTDIGPADDTLADGG
jgi:hypothetical protein